MTDVCGDNRFEIIEKAKQDLLESTNISSLEDEMKVLDRFLFRCWQMGWLDRYDVKESGCEVNCTTKSEDLVEELDNFLKDPVFGKLINRNAGIALANHFTEWQKEKMNLRLQTEYEKGLFDLREAMMKDAVEGEIGDIMPLIEVGEMNNYLNYVKAHGLKTGDRVKIIIVKEE